MSETPVDNDNLSTGPERSHTPASAGRQAARDRELSRSSQTMVAQIEAQRRLVLHGAIILLIGLLCGLPSVIEEANRSGRMWQAAHSALLMLGVWLIATAAVLPLLELPRREREALLLSLTGGAYSFMTAAGQAFSGTT